MQSLQQKASELSGVDRSDAFAIDDTNLFQKLGLQTFINLSTNFCTRAYKLYFISKKEDAIRNQCKFLVQRMRGPPLYSQRKGKDSDFTFCFYNCLGKCMRTPWGVAGVSSYWSIGHYSPFPVTHQVAERWLRHMQQALDGMTDIDADSKIKMMNFFRHTAFFLVAGDKLKNSNQGVPFKDGTDRPAAAQGDFTMAEDQATSSNWQHLLQHYSSSLALLRKKSFGNTEIRSQSLNLEALLSSNPNNSDSFSLSLSLKTMELKSRGRKLSFDILGAIAITPFDDDNDNSSRSISNGDGSKFSTSVEA
ncbi:Two-on-two hemoglobin-3 [Camellia lanceoleosa]|uniref:Two-on-two hemoglobin-3 n=1 Tax=Camellia lanceoleosa TaxID=1840588 RepID=A0ACC0FFP6_9ERIC|nr:Two-on-two hemoglobin-3 [Camellia lanceoleosa]